MQVYPLPDYRISVHANSSKHKTLLLNTPKVMGILNVTPDSFSDGGRHNKLDAALQHCENMLDAGADIIDIGGESTRPNAATVVVEEELERVVPVVEAIRQRFGDAIWLSIDTSSAQVIQSAVQAGADIWNDVRALKKDGAVAMAARLNVPVILMHMRGEPSTMGSQAHYANLIDEVCLELQQRVATALAAGVKRSNMIIDPGFGFAKNYQHHMTLLNQLSQLHQLNLPILFGISRKRFLGEVLDKSQVEAFKQHTPSDRDGVGMAAALIAIQQGVSIVRTHNVALTQQAVALWQQLQV